MIKSVILLLTILISSGFAQNFKEFKEIANLSYLYRMQINESYVYLKKVMDKDYLLTGRDIKLISDEVKKRVDLYERSQKSLNALNSSLSSSIKNKDDLLKSFMYLGTFLVSTDSFYYSLDQLSRNYKLRRILDEENLSNGQKSKIYSSSLKNLFSTSTRRKVLKALKIFKQNKDRFLNDDEFIKTKKIITESYTFKNKKDLGFHDSFKGYTNFLKNKFVAKKNTGIFNLRQRTLNLLYKGSKIFGNTAGRFQSRKGKLYNNIFFIKHLGYSLQPLDTLLEKTPFRLTDKFIPGFWGHAAIYIGNEKQLKQLDLWNHPSVVKYHTQIRSGNTIVEALRSGVKINSIGSFSDIDDFALLRLQNDLSVEQKKDYIIRVLSHIGKEYDFAFNVETPSKIVCSELHYLTYLDVKFDIEYILGQPTISVDSVAKQGMINKPFKATVLYRDGKRQRAKQQFLFDQILKNVEQTFTPMEIQYAYYLD